MSKNSSVKAGLPAADAFSVTPGEAVVKEICSIVSNMCGIQLGERQHSMVVEFPAYCATQFPEYCATRFP